MEVLNTQATKIISNLTTAVKAGNEDEVRDLLNSLRKIDEEKGSSFMEPQSGFDLLRNSLQEKRNSIAKLLLEYGVSVNTSLKTRYNTPLHLAIKNNDPEMFRIILSHGGNKEASNPQNKFPLYYAVELDNEEIVEMLLENNVKVDVQNSSTVISAVVKNGNEKLFNLLNDYFKKVLDSEYDDSKSMLRVAVEEGAVDTVKKIIEKYKDSKLNNKPKNRMLMTIAVPNDKGSCREIIGILLAEKFPIDPKNAKDAKFLHAALRRNFPSIVDKLLPYDIDPNLRDAEGNTLFTAACEHRHVDIAKILIKNADINAKNQSGHNNILFHIITNFISIINEFYCRWQKPERPEELINYFNKWLKILKILIKKGINVNEKNDKQQTPLHSLAKKYSREEENSLNLGSVAKLLLKAGADVKATDPLGNTPLEYAIQKECADVVEVLLPFTSIKYKNSKLRTLLHHTAENKSSTIVEMILKRKPNVNAIDKDGCTPLHLAAQHKSSSVIESLIKHNADVNARDHQHRTPLHWAAQSSNSMDVVGKLVTHQADLNCLDKNGLTPLMIATQRSWHIKFKLVEFLLYSGANPNIRDKSGKTILHMIAGNNDDFIPTLLDYNADINIVCNENKTALDYLREAMVTHLKDHGMDFYERRFLDRDIFSFSRDYRKNIHFLIEFMVMLKNIGLYISDENFRSIDRYWDAIGWAYEKEDTPKVVKKTNVDDFKKRCEKEAELLNSWKIGDTNITLGKLLKKSTHQLARVMNKSISAELAPSKFTRKFPIYREFINKRVEKALERRKLLNLFTENYSRIFFSTLPYACVDEIMSYLRQQDIEELLRTIVESNLHLQANTSAAKVKSEKKLKHKTKKQKLC